MFCLDHRGPRQEAAGASADQASDHLDATLRHNFPEPYPGPVRDFRPSA
jgi:hypothetical protein